MEFDKWNEVKKQIDTKEKILKFRERDIFFMHLGKNVGFEQDGKDKEFLRPVLVLKKFNARFFLGVLLTKQGKNNKYYFKLEENSYIVTSQIRTFDAKRLSYFSKRLGKTKYYELIEVLEKLLLPKRESGLSSNFLNESVSKLDKKVKHTADSVLFDLDMPKWALFFLPIIKKLQKQNINVIITSRGGDDFSELNKVLDLYNLEYISVGEYGGASLEGKLKASIDRQTKLIEIIKKHNVKVVVSGSVVDINRVGFGLGLKVINFYDMPIKGYKTNLKLTLPQIKLSIPLSTKVFKPFIVPDEVYLRLGLEENQIIEYNFLDPLIWLKDFKADINYIKKELPFIDLNKKIVVIREEEFKASYVQNQYPYLYDVIDELQNLDLNLIIIPRYDSAHLKERFKKAIVLEKKIILQHLLAFSDLFIGGGGTINIEATYFGVPVISTRSFISHYDKFLIDNNLMWQSNEKEKIINLAKKLVNKKTTQKANEVYSKMEVDIDMFVREILG